MHYCFVFFSKFLVVMQHYIFTLLYEDFISIDISIATKVNNGKDFTNLQRQMFVDDLHVPSTQSVELLPNNNI